MGHEQERILTTSNTYLFNPDLAEMVDEAFERAGIDPADIGYRHIVSARRSMNLMFSRWINRGVLTWAVDHAQHTVTQGEISFVLPDGGLDILSANLERDGTATPMQVMDRGEYHRIVDKMTQGRPGRYFVERTNATPVVHYWQAAGNDSDVIDFWFFRQIQDAGNAHNTLDMPPNFAEAFVSGLAAHLAEKYSPARLSEKQQLYQRAFEEALINDGSRAPLNIGFKYG